jgi:hypothetical protein
VLIRELNLDDIRALAELPGETYAKTFGHSFTEPQLASLLKEAKSEDYFRNIFKRDTILVAVKTEHLAGYIQLGYAEFDGEGLRWGKNDQAIHALYVHSDFPGAGYRQNVDGCRFRSSPF